MEVIAANDKKDASEPVFSFFFFFEWGGRHERGRGAMKPKEKVRAIKLVMRKQQR